MAQAQQALSIALPVTCPGLGDMSCCRDNLALFVAPASLYDVLHQQAHFEISWPWRIGSAGIDSETPISTCDLE